MDYRFGKKLFHTMLVIFRATTKGVEHRELNPVEMWLEDRWVLTRRIYGSELTQKLFIQCWNWIYAQNDINGNYFHQLQDAIVSQLFNQDPRSFFKTMKESTWIEYWDNTCGGFISQNTAHALSKKINILGPIAAIFGRDFELFIVTEYRLCTCPVEKLEESIQNTSGTLSKESLDQTPTGTSNWGQRWSYPDEDQKWHGRGQSSTEWNWD